MLFDRYRSTHAERLRALSEEDAWQEALAGGALEEARRNLLTPRKTAGVFALPVAQLKACNEAAVRERIAAGERDEAALVRALGAWPRHWPADLPVRLSFLGLNLTPRCDMEPRCVYCNQRPVAESMAVEDWRTVLRSLAVAEGEGPYVYLTGGEPLLLGEDLWGPEGLLRTAHAAGAACNLNTNALALHPRAALGVVSAGLGRVHVSLDTHRPEVQDELCQGAGRWAQVLRGVCNLQVARALLGVDHPVLHINCVVTRRNADDFPEFLRFLLDLKPRPEEKVSSDFDLHLIPVGGEQNRDLRLSADEYMRFFTDTWEKAEAVWQEYLAAEAVPQDQRGPLHQKIPFMSPFHRVEQRGDVRAWAEAAARGLPASLALTQRCYVAPTQSFLLPDGSQHWCGGHATSRPRPLGNVREASVQENLRRAVGQAACLPGPHCHTCAGATQAINRSVENALRQAVREWLSPEGPPPTPSAESPEPAFE
jgi:sulfatase maturation enzyme AslB (radical SAM superfamily)